MKTTKIVTREVEVIASVTCNKCGNLCTTPTLERYQATHPDYEKDWAYSVDVNYSTGYYSDALPDGTSYSFSLCEPCLKALMDTFVVPADVNEYV